VTEVITLPTSRGSDLPGSLSPSSVRRLPWRRALPGLVAASDMAAAAVAASVESWLAEGKAAPFLDPATPNRTALVVAVLAPMWALVLASHGAYDPTVLGAVGEPHRRVARASVTLVALVAVGLMLAGGEADGEAVLVAVALTAVLTSLVRVAGRSVVHRVSPPREMVRRTVLYGSRAETSALADLLREDPSMGIEVVGTYPTDVAATQRHARLPGGAPEQSVLRLMALTRADVVAVTAGVAAPTLRRLVWALEGTGTVLMAPAVAGAAAHPVALESMARLPLLRIEGCRMRCGRLVAKRVVDVAGAGLLLMLLSPVLAVAATAVKVTSPGPVIFSQTRVGQHGRRFSFLKLRTMVADADARLPSLADRNTSDGLLFKVHDDPRITPVGKFLRRSSIDELPQLWNVLRGEMSLVGPRPLPVRPDDFVGDERRRLRVKPGITGLWQVSGRADLTWAETVRLDMHYVDQWSLGMDASILLRTPAVVLRGGGAY
jgi:exopolysaccharide biosynthesis polyprenyl glycosylphosphotransferase